MDFNGVAADDVEDKVGFDNQDPVTVLSEFRMSGDASQERVILKLAEPFIDLFNEGQCPSWTVICDEFQNGKEIVLGNRQIPKGSLTGHVLDGAAWSSSDSE